MLKRFSYQEAKTWAIENKIKSKSEFQALVKRGETPPEMPPNPSSVYKNSKEWTSWNKFFDFDFLPFEDAREHVRSLNLIGKKSWIAYTRDDSRPLRIPEEPDKIYAKDWNGWFDFLTPPKSKKKTKKKTGVESIQHLYYILR